MTSRKKKKRGIPRGYIYIALFIFAFVMLMGGIFYTKKYAPTKEHMELGEYFEIKGQDGAAVILNADYIQEPADCDFPYAINENGHTYLEIGFVKDFLDDGYVYDSNEITLRYATDTEIYSAVVGNKDYTIDKSNVSFGYNILIAQKDTVYIAADYVKLLTDFQYIEFAEPNRVWIETAGFEKKVTETKGKTQIRKLNGPKSPVLEDVVKGESLTVVRDTGKWSFVISENGVMGFIRNNKLGELKDTVIETTLAERNYKHINVGNDILMVWHQVTNKDSNSDIANVIAKTSNVDVISPTWFYLNDNNGGIANISSANYVNYCHDNGIQVWALVSNLENAEVDSTAVLNSTSARDKLVNNLIAAAITNGIDGINVDFEELSGNARDGFIQFIRELSIKCEKNDLVLSVDNYAPSASSGFYNRAEQAKYADYVVIMAYDEHYGGSQEAGSVASLDWVNEAVVNTLKEVPAEQIILGMPFYCRAWEIDANNEVSSKAYGMDAIQKFISGNDATPSWDATEGQYYAEFIKDDKTYKIWVEDPESIEAKLKVMDSYGLAGGAFWKLGFDNSAVWNILAKYL